MAAADPANHRIELENELLRVVRYSIAPHRKTAIHGHPGSVEIALSDQHAKMFAPDGTR